MQPLGNQRIEHCEVHSNSLGAVGSRNTVGCATTNECYNEQFLSIKSGCYNESGGILFIMKTSIIVFTRKRLFTPR
jgi:hypothetical protein